MYVLDTNVISELRAGKAQPSQAVRAWAAKLGFSVLWSRPPSSAHRCTSPTRSRSGSMIAACALEHGFTLATRNVRDFDDTLAKLVNPWESVR